MKGYHLFFVFILVSVSGFLIGRATQDYGAASSTEQSNWSLRFIEPGMADVIDSEDLCQVNARTDADIMPQKEGEKMTRVLVEDGPKLAVRDFVLSLTEERISIVGRGLHYTECESIGP